MKHYFFNYHANHATHAGEFWAASRDRVEAMILRAHPEATDIHIWPSAGLI